MCVFEKEWENYCVCIWTKKDCVYVFVNEKVSVVNVKLSVVCVCVFEWELWMWIWVCLCLNKCERVSVWEIVCFYANAYVWMRVSELMWKCVWFFERKEEASDVIAFCWWRHKVTKFVFLPKDRFRKEKKFWHFYSRCKDITSEYAFYE